MHVIENSSGFNDIRVNLTALTDNMVQLNKKVEANASLIDDSSSSVPGPSGISTGEEVDTGSALCGFFRFSLTLNSSVLCNL